MNESETIPSAKRASASRRITGSFVSAAAGWVSLNVIGTIIYLCTEPGLGRLLGPLLLAGYSAAFVFAAWVVALLPLYLLVPPSSVLWRWPVCTVCGALAGAGIMFVISRFIFPLSYFDAKSVVVPAFVGAITCLFASLTAPFFRHDRKCLTNHSN
ncbi:MAG TPA: hypothetical protein VM735_12015 [Candidatus Kapabacteria bacterium]|nr:hypothetical protein [Candidatus Kapabacteria bacterium]